MGRILPHESSSGEGMERRGKAWDEDEEQKCTDGRHEERKRKIEADAGAGRKCVFFLPLNCMHSFFIL